LEFFTAVAYLKWEPYTKEKLGVRDGKKLEIAALPWRSGPGP
jgi:hypothetical protein